MKLVISIVAILFLAACAPKIVEVEVPVRIEPPSVNHPIAPDAIITRPVEFRVITAENSADLYDTNRVWYAITVDSYENIAYNVQSMLRYIREQNAIISYYQNVYSY